MPHKAKIIDGAIAFLIDNKRHRHNISRENCDLKQLAICNSYIFNIASFNIAPHSFVPFIFHLMQNYPELFGKCYSSFKKIQKKTQCVFVLLGGHSLAHKLRKENAVGRKSLMNDMPMNEMRRNDD
jgi:hypothetical protein